MPSAINVFSVYFLKIKVIYLHKLIYPLKDKCLAYHLLRRHFSSTLWVFSLLCAQQPFPLHSNATLYALLSAIIFCWNIPRYKKRAHLISYPKLYWKKNHLRSFLTTLPLHQIKWLTQGSLVAEWPMHGNFEYISLPKSVYIPFVSKLPTLKTWYAVSSIILSHSLYISPFSSKDLITGEYDGIYLSMDTLDIGVGGIWLCNLTVKMLHIHDCF